MDLRDTLYAGPRGFVHRPFGAHTSAHALHAHKLVIPVDAPILLDEPSGGPPQILDHPVFVPAHRTQAMGSEGEALALFWEPEPVLGRALGQAHARRCHVLGGSRGRWLRGLARRAREHVSDEDAMKQVLGQVAARLAGADAKPPALDGRIARLVEHMTHRPTDAPSREEAARQVGLSPSYLSRLFARQIGIPYQRYALWLRTRAAIVGLLGGCAIAEAAASAGFADHAHLTRSMRRFVGQPPSYLR